MAETGKKVPERNIIGLVMTLVTASAVSGSETSEPTVKPITRKHSAPARAIGMAAQAVPEMWMPNATRPNTISTPSCNTASVSEAAIRETRNSHSGIGVSFRRRSTPRFLHATSTVERPITAEIMIERARMPGSRKSM